MRFIEIDLDEPNTPSFADVLRALGQDARDIPWLILDLGEVLPSDGVAAVTEMPDRVRDAERGVALTYDELDAFARDVSQVVDGVFLGGTVDASRGATIAINVQRATYLLAVVDSSFWLIGGPADAVARAQAAFPASRIAPVSRVSSLRYWS